MRCGFAPALPCGKEPEVSSDSSITTNLIAAITRDCAEDLLMSCTTQTLKKPFVNFIPALLPPMPTQGKPVKLPKEFVPQKKLDGFL